MIIDNSIFTALTLSLGYLASVITRLKLRSGPNGTFPAILIPVIEGELASFLLYSVLIGSFSLSSTIFVPKPWLVLSVFFATALLFLSKYQSPVGIWLALFSSTVATLLAWIITPAVTSPLIETQHIYYVVLAGLTISFLRRGLIWVKKKI